jgi:hypothetical protein
VAAALVSVTVATPPTAEAQHAAPAYAGDFPDPFVLRVGALYYAFATGSAGVKIQVMTSADRQHWAYLGDALANLPAWSSFGSTWAPSVIALGGRFVLYYTTHDDSSGDQCISYATSASPSGPYQDTTTSPAICQTALSGSIDPSPFVDTDGTPYLLWKSNGVAGSVSSQIWTGRLVPDGSGLLGSPTVLVGQDQSWEAPTIEGPAMIRDGNQFDLFYTGNNWYTASYAIGMAVCSGPMGPCHKPIAEPVFTSDATVAGPGAPAFFTDLVGGTWMAYAGWDPSVVGYAGGGKRTLRFAPVSFRGGRPVLDEVPGIDGSNGYRVAGANGTVRSYGDAGSYGELGGVALNRPVVGIADDPRALGYWLVASDGGIFSFGGATFFGSTGGMRLNQPVVGMAATADGGGYWLVAGDGGIFTFGNARFYGSTGAMRLTQPIVGMAATPDGGGYWLVAADGGIFTFGNARFYGSTGAMRLNQPIVGIGPTPDGRGYWLVAADGGVFCFGDARYFGSTGALRLNQPVLAIAPDGDGGGYWLLAADGGVFTFGDAHYLGSAVGSGGISGRAGAGAPSGPP